MSNDRTRDTSRSTVFDTSMRFRQKNDLQFVERERGQKEMFLYGGTRYRTTIFIKRLY